MAALEEDQWAARARALLEEMNGRLAFYAYWAEVNRKGQRITSLLIVVCSVLAPVTVISTPEVGLGIFGLGVAATKALSLIFTITVALSEGVRRVFRFEHRWAVCANCRETIKRQRDKFIDQQIGKQVGSEEWIANLTTTRNAFDDVVMWHLQDFAYVLAGNDGKKRTAGAGSAK